MLCAHALSHSCLVRHNICSAVIRRSRTRSSDRSSGGAFSLTNAPALEHTRILRNSGSRPQRTSLDNSTCFEILSTPYTRGDAMSQLVTFHLEHGPSLVVETDGTELRGPVMRGGHVSEMLTES